MNAGINDAHNLGGFKFDSMCSLDKRLLIRV